MNISDKIKYIGVDDTTIDLFESQYAVPDGVSYNSYVILDDKTAIMDTVDKRGMKDWENNLLNALDGRNADYVIIQHMEPDHAGSLARLIELFPEITVVGNAKTFVMINQFFENINIKNSLTVKEGDTLNLGSHTLTFVMAPMVHWPEVMVTYELCRCFCRRTGSVWNRCRRAARFLPKTFKKRGSFFNDQAVSGNMLRF